MVQNIYGGGGVLAGYEYNSKVAGQYSGYVKAFCD